MKGDDVEEIDILYDIKKKENWYVLLETGNPLARFRQLEDARHAAKAHDKLYTAAHDTFAIMVEALGGHAVD